MSKIFTVKQTAQRQPAFSEASLRYHIFNADKNGLSSAILRVGRKILICEDTFLEWIKNQQTERGS